MFCHYFIRHVFNFIEFFFKIACSFCCCWCAMFLSQWECQLYLKCPSVSFTLPKYYFFSLNSVTFLLICPQIIGDSWLLVCIIKSLYWVVLAAEEYLFTPQPKWIHPSLFLGVVRFLTHSFHPMPFRAKGWAVCFLLQKLIIWVWDSLLINDLLPCSVPLIPLSA